MGDVGRVQQEVRSKQPSASCDGGACHTGLSISVMVLRSGTALGTWLGSSFAHPLARVCLWEDEGPWPCVVGEVQSHAPGLPYFSCDASVRM